MSLWKLSESYGETANAPVDAQRQERLWDWLDSINNMTMESGKLDLNIFRLILRLKGDVDPKLVSELKRAHKEMRASNEKLVDVLHKVRRSVGMDGGRQ